PDRLTGARHARVAEANLIFPFGREIVIKGTELFRLRQARVVPNTVGAHIGQEGIEVAIGTEIILPYMATPPLFWILDLGENQQGLDRLEHAVMGEAYGRARADDQGIEITQSRLALRGDPACIAWARRGD